MSVYDIALGVKVFSRVDKLKDLLDSVKEAPIESVYIADDGEETEAKTELYNREYSFDLEVLNLEYDAGLGYGRNRIVEVFDEEYLLIVDSDHEVPSNVSKLAEQLEERPELGGVSGLLYEDRKIRGTCHDLFEDGDILVRDVREDKPVEMAAGAPLIEFDFLPNAALFRRECLLEQSWDSEYVIGKEHLDFYVAHLQKTDWRFAVSPTILFPHFPGGDSKYVADRDSQRKLDRSRSYFMEKWGYEQILLGQTDWIDGSTPYCTSRFGAEQLVKSALLAAPPKVKAHLMTIRNWIRRRRNLRPL